MTRKRLLDPRRWPSLVVFPVVLVLVFLLGSLLASLGIQLMGSRAAFDAAKQAALPWLFLWRWACYAGLAVGWIRLWKPRVVQRLNEDRDGGQAARQRLARLEYLAIGALVCIELFNLIDWLGGES